MFALLFLWAFIYFLKFCVDRVLPPKEITLVPFEVNSVNLKLAPESPPKILSAKLQKLRQEVGSKPGGYGFLDIPRLGAIPDEAKQRQNEILGKVQNLDLKIKEVDVNKLLDAIQTFFSPPKTTLQGQITELVDTLEIHCELVAKGRTISAWSSSRKKSQAASNDELVDGSIDDIMFQMIYDIPRDPKLRHWLNSSQVGADDLPNWKALQAFNHGLSALQEYQQDLSYDALKRAIQYFGRMHVVAPEYGLGLYFYGLALAENREEAAAADVFDRIQRLNASDSVKSEARFQRAAALLRLYNPDEARAAVKELEGLIKDLQSKQAGATSPKDQAYHNKLLAISHAQLAYTHGTMIVIFHDPSHYSFVQPEIDAARKEFGAVPSSEWSSETEKNDIAFRIDNAAGYSLFRYAQSDDQSKFGERCEQAIKLLNDADGARPNHYEVLQNLAMIYDDEFYDPKGTHLESAQQLYERTLLFVPNDYYQYERLARIEWRRLRSADSPELKLALAKKGKEYAVNAISKRAQARESLWLFARFGAEIWRHTAANDKDRFAMAKQVDEQIQTAAKAGFRNVSLLLECAEFLLDAAGDKNTPKIDSRQFKRDAKLVLDGAEERLNVSPQSLSEQQEFLDNLRKRLSGG